MYPALGRLKARPLVKPIYDDERATKNPYRPYDWAVEVPELVDDEPSEAECPDN